MQPQSDQNTSNPTNSNNHVTVAGLEFENSTVSELESAFASELQSIKATPQQNTPKTNSVPDLKDKIDQIKNKQENWTKEEDILKSDIEQKIQDLKNLKKTIEEELANLKDIEQKKSILDNEIKKIEDLEKAQKDVEEEINNLIAS
ncbi:MAG: hypothetical protein ACR2IQ_01570 [Minisyncoccia bacterium]